MAQPQLQGTNNIFKDNVSRGQRFHSLVEFDDRCTRLEGDLVLVKTSIQELEKQNDEILVMLKKLNDKLGQHQSFGHPNNKPSVEKK